MTDAVAAALVGLSSVTGRTADLRTDADRRQLYEAANAETRTPWSFSGGRGASPM